MKLKLMKRYNTIFFRLLFSYIALTLLITLVLGITSYTYFTKNFNDEVIKLHHKMLEHVQNSIEIKLLQKIEKSYIDIALQGPSNQDIHYLLNAPIEGNHLRAYNAKRYLDSLVSTNSNIIDSISIYYKNSNIIISSKLGLKFLNEEVNQDYIGLDWITKVNSSGKSSFWIDTRQVPDDIKFNINPAPYITYVHTFPFTNTMSDYKAIVAISVKEDVLKAIMHEFLPDDYINSFIIGTEGNIIAHTNNTRDYNELKDAPYISKILSSPNAFDSFIDNSGETTSLISYTTLEQTKWKLVNITSTEQFYRKSASIQKVLLILCMGSLVIGLGLTSIFTSTIYNPLKAVINGIKNLLGTSKSFDMNKDNEYIIINHAINELSIKVTELEKTLVEYKPVIKRNLALGLLNNTILSGEDLKEHLDLLGISVNCTYFACMGISLDEQAINALSLENKHFIVYNVINYIEGMNRDDSFLIAIDQSASDIFVIAGFNSCQDRVLQKIAEQVISYIYDNFMIETSVMVGNWTDDLLHIYNSFKDIIKYKKYRYFLYKEQIIYCSLLAQRENGKDEIPVSITEDISKGLNTRDLDLIKKSMDKFIELTEKGPYSADHCHQVLLNITYIFSNYLKSINYSLPDDDRSGMFKVFDISKDICRFTKWFINTVEKVIMTVESRNANRSSEVVNRVREYVNKNIDGDLSLETVAQKVHLSPRYLSKLFKEDTGMNFVEYVTLHRMEKARELIFNTNLSIEEVSARVGYNSSNYFIKKFKETYGETPRNYKQIHVYNSN